MAKMMRCPMCKGRISIEAESCPKCGHPITDDIRNTTASQNKKYSRSTYIIAFTILFAAYAYSSHINKNKDHPDVQNEQTSTPVQAQQPQDTHSASVQNLASFLMDVDKFIITFNNNLKSIDNSSSTIKKLQKSFESNENTTSIEASLGRTNKLLFISDKKTGNIQRITLISGGETFSQKEAKETIFSWVSLIQTLSPELNAEERGSVLRELGLVKKPFQQTGMATRNGVRYWQRNGGGLGLWFGADAVNE